MLKCDFNKVTFITAINFCGETKCCEFLQTSSANKLFLSDAADATLLENENDYIV